MISIKEILSLFSIITLLQIICMNTLLLGLIGLMGIVTPIYASIITLSFRAYPDFVQITKNLKHPAKLANHTMNRVTARAPIAGIFGIYAGFIQVSDRDGQMIFPRK